jgi:hypothetical protein
MTFRKDIDIAKKHKDGLVCEAMAKAILTAKGFIVFAPISDKGPIDIIALNPITNEFKYYDVKKVSYRSIGTKISRSRPKNTTLKIEMFYIDLRKETYSISSGKNGLVNEEFYYNKVIKDNTI